MPEEIPSDPGLFERPRPRRLDAADPLSIPGELAGMAALGPEGVEGDRGIRPAGVARDSEAELKVGLAEIRRASPRTPGAVHESLGLIDQGGLDAAGVLASGGKRA